jgi:hypothetical protein
VADNDLPDLLARWPQREDGPRSMSVDADRIRQSRYNFAPGAYRERAAVQRVDADATGALNRVEGQLTAALKDLEVLRKELM